VIDALSPLIQVEHISFVYPGDAERHPQPALRDVSLSIMPGELMALIGQNGSGKTTLAKHLNGLLKPASGRVIAGGIDTRTVPVGESARHVGYVYQNPDHQLFLPSIRAEIAYGPEQLGLTGAELDQRVDETLARFELGEIADQHPAMLGRGLRRLTALAAVAAMGPRVLVLDEPTGGLDVRRTTRLMKMLHGLVGEGRAVVLISHEMALVAAHATRVVVLRGGAIIADATPAEVFDRAELLASTNVQPPTTARIAGELRDAGLPLERGIATVDRFCAAYADLLDQRIRR
jgi:energy-coupling factor transporter ATP-binding protein EcfA2